MALTVLFSCIEQGMEECPPPGPVDDIRQLLYLRVTDGVTRVDITDTEELDDIMVYLFDRNEKLVDTVAFTTAMMRQGTPINLTDKGLDGGYVSVWANIGNAVEIDKAGFGDDIDDLEIRMLPNDSRTDFFLCPGDIFFGYKQIEFAPVDQVTEADTVWLERKNSKLNVTVRGLPKTGNAEDYYFRIGSLYSAYDFEGTPQLVPREIWEEGSFDDASDYISPEPYIMIHNAPGHIYGENSRVLVGIYRTVTTRADTLIASGDRDTDGKYIPLEQGKTTNVLIIIEQTGEIILQTIITPWDEIHQWTIW